ncbi:hypothetical protein D1007_22742 [Hordeum vulgare]|nr:hypothetical protein D1007_22742 [Hordeum vulgare]
MADSSGSWKIQRRESAKELLAQLTLQEEEEYDFVWEEEVPDMVELAKWLAIARVHTPKTFSPNALYGGMRAAWNPAKLVVWRKIKDNILTTKFGCLGNWNNAKFEGTWFLREEAVIMEEYDGFKNPDTIKLDKLALWVQIHCLSNNFLTESTMKGLRPASERWNRYD